MVAEPGEVVRLKASATDPDGDPLDFRWWHYLEAGSSGGQLEIEDGDSPYASLTVPEQAVSGQSIHLILEVKDSGSPPLTRFARVIVTVE